MNIHFTEGYEYYKAHGDSTQFDLRTKHPMWRAGFNSAKSETFDQSNIQVPKVLYKVPPIPDQYKFKWDDVVCVTKRPRYRLLHDVPELYPILSAILHKAFENREKFKSYSELRNYVGKLFDAVLEYGHKEGILTAEDLEFNGYKK